MEKFEKNIQLVRIYFGFLLIVLLQILKNLIFYILIFLAINKCTITSKKNIMNTRIHSNKIIISRQAMRDLSIEESLVEYCELGKMRI